MISSFPRQEHAGHQQQSPVSSTLCKAPAIVYIAWCALCIAR
jgi:hypothetical protein